MGCDVRDLYLKFPDESSAKTHLYDIKYHHEVYGEGEYYSEVHGHVEHHSQAHGDGQEIVREELTPRYQNIDIIGTLMSEEYTEEMDWNGMPVRAYIPLPGWHVNIRALPDEDIESLLQFEVHPTNPRRVWA